MTEKRFMLDDAGELIDLNNHKFVDYGEECCNLLNELAEDVEKQREFKFSAIRQANRIDKENEQLKQLLDYADDLIQSYMSVHNRDEWENVKKNITGDVE